MGLPPIYIKERCVPRTAREMVIGAVFETCTSRVSLSTLLVFCGSLLCSFPADLYFARFLRISTQIEFSAFKPNPEVNSVILYFAREKLVPCTSTYSTNPSGECMGTSFSICPRWRGCIVNSIFRHKVTSRSK